MLGMWKAFDEMERLGFIGSERPNMISVQSAGCAPVVKAWDEGRGVAEMWPHASTLASGLRVPKPDGDYLILDILKKSEGLALAATDPALLDTTRHWAKVEGIFAAPEGAASLISYQKSLVSGSFSSGRYRCAFEHRLRLEVSRCAGYERCC
jgi:threonine synthase